MRNQRILWWVFVVNLVCGGLGASGAAKTLGAALHHSLAGEKLAKGFDLAMLLELARQPEVRLFSQVGLSFVFAGLYFLFLLLVTPGIITVYIEDRRFSTGEFLGACGAFFWPFVRLALWSLIPFGIAQFLQGGIGGLAGYVDERAVSAQASFYVRVIGMVPVLLLLVWGRMWFDVAQVRAVMLQERGMRRNAVRVFGMAGRLWRVFWSYVGIALVAWVVTIIALVIWAKLPPTALAGTLLLLEIIMLAHIFGRLWQKACATSWYVWNPEMPVAVEPLPLAPVLPVAGGEISAVDVDRPLSDEVEPPSSQEFNPGLYS
jgi:hypothetical protein